MRQIKFRAWDKEFNEMFDWSELLKFAPTLKAFFENEDIVKMQYTGLKDKNGREIYEGDILTSGVMKYITGYHEHSGGWQLEVRKGEYCAEMVQSNCDLLEIIGNIYENPELLRGDVE